MAVFASRQIVIQKIIVTITGSGDSTRCYAIINGTKKYSGRHEVNIGDTITFGVYGRNSTNYGALTIDGTQVLKVTNEKTQTYDWTVPSGISTIEIDLNTAKTFSYGRITVTTA